MLAIVSPGIIELIIIGVLAVFCLGGTEALFRFFAALLAKSPYEWIAFGLSRIGRGIVALQEALKDLEDSLFR